MVTAALAALILHAPAAGAFAADASRFARGPQRAEAEEAEEAAPGEEPPLGTEGELALWRAGQAATREIWLSRRASMELRNRVLTGDYAGRLDRAIAAADGARAARLQQARTRLRDADLENLEVFRRRWTIDPYRGCGYPQLHYDNALRLAPGPDRRFEIESTARDLRSCVDRAAVPVKAMRAANVALAEALDAAEGLLAAALPKPGLAEGRGAHGGLEPEVREGDGGRPVKE